MRLEAHGQRGDSVADLLEAAAARWPAATAVEAGDASLTYSGLDDRANRLAHHLRALGVGPDRFVGVCLERSVDLAVSLVAVLKAGGACVPLDPSYPRDRVAFMADDAGVAAVVTRGTLAGRLPAGTAPVVLVEERPAVADGEPVTGPPPRSTGPGDVAYVIYTSGSTGRPKGVLLTHGGLVNHHRAVVDLYDLGPGDRVLQFCSIGFDASIEEMFPTWAAGATVVFRPEDAPILGRGWLAWLRARRVTVVNLPTAYWHEWARDVDALGERAPEHLRLVVVGGEKARGTAFRTWWRLTRGRARWVNAYGPTETTCMSTAYEAPPDGAGIGEDFDPPIGRPLANTVVRVVDEGGAPVPAGVTGELLIGGAGVARGYLNQPQLTAERFVELAGVGRVYRSGDMVRELPGGDLDYVGRGDDQVKVRGFRVECGEVEAALGHHPCVDHAVVTAARDGRGETQLVAYAVPRTGGAVTAGELRRFLTERLPAHMVPSVFAVLDAFPLTPNGKVDRDRLPVPGPVAIAGRRGVAPRSPTERRLAAIWGRVLGIDAGDVGIDDDFFDLGGHSLLATQVIAQLREELGTDTPLRAIFDAPTLGALAAAIDAERGHRGSARELAAVPRRPGERLPLSVAQEQMWALEVAADPPGLYNVTALHRFGQPVDEAALREALGHLVGRHEVLRTGIVVESGRPWQRVAASAPIDLGVTDLRDVPAGERGERLQALVAEVDAAPFDPARPPLLRARLFLLDDDASELAVTMDHLVTDGTSVSIFMSELGAAYEAFVAGRRPALPPLDIQFADFAVWQRAHVTEEVLERQLEWWAKALDAMPLGPAVPFDQVPATPTRRIASRPLAVAAGTRRRLEEVARGTASTVFIVAVAGVQAVLGRAGGTTDVVVSTTLSGRTRVELEGMLGMFAGIGRIRTDLAGDPSFLQVVEHTREHVLGMFENQDVPFMRVRRALLPDFPSAGVELLAALPVELQYFFHTGRATWGASGAPGERRHGYWHDQELYFRGQLHPLSITLLDDGRELTGGISYKVDFYEPATIERLAGNFERVLEAVAADPSLRWSELPVTPRPSSPGPAPPNGPARRR